MRISDWSSDVALPISSAAKVLPATRHALINSNAFAMYMNVLPERLWPWGRLSPLHHIRKRRMGEGTALTKGVGCTALAFLCCWSIFAYQRRLHRMVTRLNTRNGRQNRMPI